MAKARQNDWRTFLLFLGLVLSLAFIAFFAVRAARFAPRRLVDEPIRPWMSLTYVAHSYKVPAYVLYDTLKIPRVLHDRRPISLIARELNQPVNGLVSKLQEAIIHSRPPFPTPLPAPTPTPSQKLGSP